MLGMPVAALAQTVPDSNMGRPTGDTGAADNGIGHQGALRSDAGTHASTVVGAAAAARIPISPRSAPASGHDQKLENEPALGGGQQK